MFNVYHDGKCVCSYETCDEAIEYGKIAVAPRNHDVAIITQNNDKIICTIANMNGKFSVVNAIY